MKEYLISFGERLLAPNYKREPILFLSGEGVYLYDDKGEKFYDFCAGIAVCNLGHAHPELVKVIKDQAEKLWHVSNLYYTEPQIELAEKLINLSFEGRVFFANSGAEAVEASLKLARRFAFEKGERHKKRFIALENSFHGRTFGALSITGQPKYHEGFEPLVPEVIFVPPNDLNNLEKAFNDRVCALILEPVQGEGGVVPLSQEFLNLARELCDKHNALLIFDEVQTGIGRTGKFFAYEHFRIEPDIICIAKALANGLPLSAIIAKEEVISAFKPGTHASTFGGNPIACKVASKVVELISQPDFLEEVSLKGKVLKENLLKLKQEFPEIIKEIRGLGLLIGIEFNFEGTKIYKKLIERKILTTLPKPNVLRLTPPLIISYPEIDHFIKNFAEILSEIKKEI